MNVKRAVSLGAVLLFGLIGCATSGRERLTPTPRPLGSDLPTFHAARLNEAPDRPVEEEPTGAVNLRQVLALALMKNPELAAFSWEVRAQEAAALQAALLPNPELGAALENIGLDQSETTIQLSQLIELGGKRSKRAEVASLTEELARWDYEAKRIDVLTKTSQAFVDVLGLQQQLALIEERVRLSEEVARVVSERVKAGKVSPIEETRAHVALSTAQIALDRGQQQLIVARKRLGAAWGSAEPPFEKAEGDLHAVSPIPTLEALARRLSLNPELARWATEISQRRAVIRLEKSKALPDLSVSGGVRRFNQTDENTFVAGVTIPLSFFNRNQGNISEARHQLKRAEEARRAAAVRVTVELSEAYGDLATRVAEVQALEEKVLPGARSTFEAMNEGYRLGKFGLLDVLDAQRTLFEARSQYLNALTGYHQAVAEVERLIGEPLHGIQALLEQK